jgi:phospholipase C
MDTRRSFLKKSAMLSGAAGIAHLLPPSIQKAFAISPEPGSTYLDAEHIVLLMQENRSFDHALGTLRGVRGFNDPRAITLPDKNKVWLQTNKAGETYCPFRLNIKNTKITWMGSLPHGRHSQMEARNNGKHDNWLDAKKPDAEYEKMPLTMGYYTREDIPFYYALADAFTVCDQNFCSSLTGTDPNRLYFWSGTVREKQHEDAKPHVQNDDVEAGVEWETFPELLEKNGVSWKVYQNEVGLDHGFTQEQDVWLGNFGDNVLEYFNQYNVKLSKQYIDYLPKKIESLQNEIKILQTKVQSLAPASKDLEEAQKKIKYKQQDLDATIEEQKKWTVDKFNSLPAEHKNIHSKAFVTNTKDPFQHELAPVNYTDGNVPREINIPKGDILHQFREDVQSGNLPTVSWLVAPEFFSDHPSAPWFGSWYLSEAMDILTQNPEVWKKTIFVLAYDENDGYFDHVPPFVAPDPRNPATGKASAGIDTSVEQVRLKQDSPGSIGLGFRVPLVIASPWSRGGFVNSQVFDHTSTLQFLENFLNKKFGKKIISDRISQWRRTVCGDLTSVFRPDNGEKISPLPFVEKEPFIEGVYKAKFKNVPINYKKLTKEEIEQINTDAHSSPFMPQQEKGVRSSCALPYELYADGKLSADKKTFNIEMKAAKEIFKEKSAGSPFNIYAPGKHANENVRLWAYAVAAGDTLKNSWAVSDFENNIYHLRLYGPNGFFREFIGDANDPLANITCAYQHNSANAAKLTGNIELKISNPANSLTVEIIDNAYKNATITKVVDAKNVNAKIILDLSKSSGWYDFSVKIKGHDLFEKRYAGHIETGGASSSDPLMGGVM